MNLQATVYLPHMQILWPSRRTHLQLWFGTSCGSGLSNTPASGSQSLTLPKLRSWQNNLQSASISPGLQLPWVLPGPVDPLDFQETLRQIGAQRGDTQGNLNLRSFPDTFLLPQHPHTFSQPCHALPRLAAPCLTIHAGSLRILSYILHLKEQPEKLSFQDYYLRSFLAAQNSDLKACCMMRNAT